MSIKGFFSPYRGITDKYNCTILKAYIVMTQYTWTL